MYVLNVLRSFLSVYRVFCKVWPTQVPNKKRPQVEGKAGLPRNYLGAFSLCIIHNVKALWTVSLEDLTHNVDVWGEGTLCQWWSHPAL